MTKIAAKNFNNSMIYNLKIILHAYLQAVMKAGQVD